MPGVRDDAHRYGQAMVLRPLRSLLLLAVTAATLTIPAVAVAEELPVPFDAPGFLAGGSNPDAAAGANDFACKPSAAHPRPVVLVHGLFATLGTNWGTMAPLLKNNGFCVFGLTYGRQPGLSMFGGLTPMEQSAEELRVFVDRVLAATGTRKVDLLGHSEGTIMPRWYLSFLGGAAKVDKYVQMTPLWEGTQLGGIDTLAAVGKTLGLEGTINSTFAGVGCGSCPQFAKGSEYLAKVDAPPGPALPTITYTGIATQYDELVIPYTSGFLQAPNVKNILLQDVCPTDFSEHLAVAYSPTVAQLILNALAPAQALPAQCTVVTPLGTPSPPKVGLAPEPGGGGATPLTPATPAATALARNPAKLTVRRLGISGGRLDLLAEITGRATGTVAGSVRSRGRTVPFTIDLARDGTRRRGALTRIRLDRRLPGLSTAATSGIVTFRYAGNARVRPDEVRLRAAAGKSRLRRTSSRIERSGDLVAAGTVALRAAGVVRVRMGYVEPSGRVRFTTIKAPIEPGVRQNSWRLRTRLPAAARSEVQLSIQYTGFERRNLRGEQLAKRVRP